MKKTELIQSLIKQTEELPFRDKESLNALLEQTDKVIRGFYGNISGYHADLKMIRFFPWSFQSSDNEFKTSWNSGKHALINLLQSIQDDPTVIIAPQETPKVAAVEPAIEIPSASPAKKKKTRKLLRAKQKATSLINKFKQFVQPSKGLVSENDKTEPTQKLEEPATVERKDENSHVIRRIEIPKIFLVHGADKEMRNVVVDTLKKMGLEPVLTREAPHLQKPIMQKYTEFADINCAVVVLSTDDFAYKKSGAPKDAKLRAYQEVIFEMGILIGKFGRNKVIVLYPEKTSFELPSAFFDALYISFDNKENWKMELAEKLKACGLTINPGTIKKL